MTALIPRSHCPFPVKPQQCLPLLSSDCCTYDFIPCWSMYIPNLSVCVFLFSTLLELQPYCPLVVVLVWRCVVVIGVHGDEAVVFRGTEIPTGNTRALTSHRKDLPVQIPVCHLIVQHWDTRWCTGENWEMLGHKIWFHRSSLKNIQVDTEQ